jgi:hypothetical protein
MCNECVYFVAPVKYLRCCRDHLRVELFPFSLTDEIASTTGVDLSGADVASTTIAVQVCTYH